MSINNLNTYSKPAFSLATMCLKQIDASEISMTNPDVEVTPQNKNSKYKTRSGVSLGIKGVAGIEKIGQMKVGELFRKAGFNYKKAYKLIDKYKESKK